MASCNGGPCRIMPICVSPIERKPGGRACAKKAACSSASCGTGTGKKSVRTKRYPMGSYGKPRPDKRIYRNGEHMCLSYAGHIPGEMYIHGRNLPTTSTFAKRRLCAFTPYEFVDPDGCCRTNCC